LSEQDIAEQNFLRSKQYILIPLKSFLVLFLNFDKISARDMQRKQIEELSNEISLLMAKEGQLGEKRVSLMEKLKLCQQELVTLQQGLNHLYLNVKF
jgi:hypothetical protein